MITVPARQVFYNFCMTSNSQPTILITDDNYINRFVIKQILKEFSFITEEAWNGDQAMKIIHRIGKDKPIIHLLDLNMPVMDGYQVIKLMRDNPLKYTNVQTIVISATMYDEFKLSGLDAYVNSYLLKPLLKIELIEKIKLITSNFLQGPSN